MEMKAALTVLVLALQIVQPDPNNKYGQSAIPGIQPGVTVHLAVSDKTRQFIQISEEESSMKTFSDDKGTDFLKSKKRFGSGPAWLGSFPDISDDGHTVKFQLRSEIMPAQGASKLTAKGKLVLLSASDEKTESQADIAMKIDEAITAGPANFTISQIDKGWGDAAVVVSLKTDDPVAAIKTVTFLDAEGKEIEANKSGTMWSGSGKNRTTTLSYGLKKKVDTFGVKITYYTKVEKVDVPIDRTITLGL